MEATPSAAGPSSDGFWDLYSRVYDAVYHLIPYRGLLWQAYEALSLEPGMRVLDAGCGTGNFEHFIAGKNPPPWIRNPDSKTRAVRHRNPGRDVRLFSPLALLKLIHRTPPVSGWDPATTFIAAWMTRSCRSPSSRAAWF